MKKSKSKLISSFIKASIGMILFILFYIFSDINIVKNKIEDPSFDVMTKYLFSKQSTKNDTPTLMLFGIDNYYLKDENLSNELNQTTYGYIFPNDKIAEFIQRLDKFLLTNKENIPKALFIDYDYSFTTSIYGQKPTIEDEIFLNTLKEPRSYTILLPKNRAENFIESSSNKIIQQLIKDKKIVFVSVEVENSKDKIQRRFFAYKTFKHAVDYQDANYTSVSLSLWEMFNNEKNFKQESVVGNRFIVKEYKLSEIIYDENHPYSYLHKKSNWKNFTYYSAHYPFENINNDNFKDAIIFLGSTTQNGVVKDNFQTLQTVNSSIRGVELQANILMTHFFLQGGLKQFDIIKSSLLVFTIFFILFMFGNQFINLLPNKLKIWIVKYYPKQSYFSQPLSFLLILAIMILCSWAIFSFYHEWFNWAIAGVLFKIIELWNSIKEYLIKIYLYIRNKIIK